MSKLSRVAEFAAAFWLLIGAALGTWALRDFFAVAPVPFTASYGITEAILVLGCLWHLRRALRGR